MRKSNTAIIGLLTLVLSMAVLPVAAEKPSLRLVTTTSTDNSGLLQRLLPVFEKRYGYRVHVIAVGTGKALRMGRDGDADVLLVHSYDDEIRFVKEGYGVNRRDVMYNDFIFVGPPSDPANIHGLQVAVSALAKIHNAGSLFLSRGDDSGTHKREKWLWDRAEFVPNGSWYREVGQGMGRVLQMADELDGYTLTDRGTWLAHKATLPHLKILVEGDPHLYNRYGIIAVNPERFKDINYAGASSLIDWITSKEGQDMIHNYKIGNETLFFPLAAKN